MKTSLVAVAILAAAIATPAFSQAYIGAGVGSSQASNVDRTVMPGVALSGGNTSKGSSKIYGGYQFTPNWGVEVQYSDLGNRNLALNISNVSTPIGSLKSSQYSVAGTGTLPLNESFSLLGKLGFTTNSSALSMNAAGFSGSASQNRTDIILGVGISYKITPKLAVRLEYEDFGKFSSISVGTNGATRMNNTSINLQYAF